MDHLAQTLLNMPLDFSTVTVATIEKYQSMVAKLYKDTYDQIKSYKNKVDALNFKTIIQPLINLIICCEKARSLCTFSRQVFLDGAIREKSSEAVEFFEKLDIEANADLEVYALFKAYFQNVFPREKNNYHPEQIRLIDKLNLNYKRNGLHITDPIIKKEIKDLQVKISELAVKYTKNLANDDTTLIFTLQELRGLPEDWLSSDREFELGKFRVTLKYPDVKPILEYAENRDTRKKVYTAFNRLCADENSVLLKDIIVSRQKLAQLLNYETHADYALETRMVKTKETVKQFLDSMNERFSPLFEQYIASLTEFAKKREHDPNFILHTFDLAYYRRLHGEATCQINMDEVKEYFPIEKVIQGTLSIYEKVLGLKFIENKKQGRWHEDVLFYEVYNENTQHTDKVDLEQIGSFYLDLYPREGKFNHAAVFDLVSSCDLTDIAYASQARALSVAAMICNFPKNATLPFEDVVTFFHEFGHLVHVLCSKTKLPQFFAFNVELDFVEAPSQMLENWCFADAALKILSEHPVTQKSLPLEYAKKIEDIEKLQSGYLYKRQILLAYYDYFIHTTPFEKVGSLDVIEFFRELQQKIINIPTIANDSLPSSFAHLVGMYDAGYYSYLISKTYAMDMFNTIFKSNPLSETSGLRYRKRVLEPGASKDGMDIIREFLGRAPQLDAFLEYCGLPRT